MDVTVNGTDKYEVNDLNSGSWSETSKKTFTVKLKKGENNIRFSNDTNFAPDMDYIIVLKK